MRARSSSKMREALAYFGGFAAIAVPGTLFLLNSEVQVAGWKLAILVIAEFTAGEAMRSGFLHRHARGRKDERR